MSIEYPRKIEKKLKRNNCHPKTSEQWNLRKGVARPQISICRAQDRQKDKKKSSNGKNKNPHSHIGHSTDCTQTNCAIASTSRASVPVIFTEYDESAPRRHISSRQQTLTTANLTVSHGPIINIVSEATQHHSSPVDQHQRSQVVPNQRPPSTLVQRVPMPVNEFTNNDLSVGAPRPPVII